MDSWLLAALLLLVTAVLAGHHAFNLFAAESRTELMAKLDSRHRIGVINDVLITLLNAETGQRGYLLTGKREYLEPYLESMGHLDEDLRRLADAYGAPGVRDARSVSLMAEIDEKVQQKRSELRHTMQLYDSNRIDGAVALVKENSGKRLMDGLREDLDQLRQREFAQRNMLEGLSEQVLFYRRIALLSAIGSGLLMVLQLVRRRLPRP